MTTNDADADAYEQWAHPARPVLHPEARAADPMREFHLSTIEVIGTRMADHPQDKVRAAATYLCDVLADEPAPHNSARWAVADYIADVLVGMAEELVHRTDVGEYPAPLWCRHECDHRCTPEADGGHV